MRLFTSLASAAALVGITAFTQDAALAPQAAAAPATVAGIHKTSQTTGTAADVVTAANAFIATLSSTQRSTLLQTYNATNVIKWSNLPCGSSCRLGLQLSNLTQAQVTAALAVVQAATGSAANDGYAETMQIRAADDNLGTQRSGYGSGIYFIAFLAPSASVSAGTIGANDTWMVQFGGHHLATNVTFGAGKFTGPTPKFEGVEPLTFTATANAATGITAGTYTPMGNEASTMVALINGLTTAHKATAKLTQTFSDVVLGPNADGQFPTTRVGIQCSQLTAAEQQLVVNAMAPWVQDADDATAASLLAYYQSQLANTYIAYSGTGNFTTNADYARIDGPNVWIEFVAQTGVVYNTQTHFHSVWRDRARDYGGNFYGTYTTALGTKAAAAAAQFSVFPSPAYTGGDVQLRLADQAAGGSYTVRNLLGQAVATGSIKAGSASVPTTGMAPGIYLMTVAVPGQAEATSRFEVR